jgi:hypothetical protein
VTSSARRIRGTRALGPSSSSDTAPRTPSSTRRTSRRRPEAIIDTLSFPALTLFARRVGSSSGPTSSASPRPRRRRRETARSPATRSPTTGRTCRLSSRGASATPSPSTASVRCSFRAAPPVDSLRLQRCSLGLASSAGARRRRRLAVSLRSTVSAVGSATVALRPAFRAGNAKLRACFFLYVFPEQRRLTCHFILAIRSTHSVCNIIIFRKLTCRGGLRSYGFGSCHFNAFFSTAIVYSLWSNIMALVTFAE